MIGKILKCFRIVNNMNIKDVTSEIDLSAAYLSEVELGKKNPSLKTLNKLCDYYRVPLSKIFEFEEIAKEQNLEYIDILWLCVKYEVEEKSKIEINTL